MYPVNGVSPSKVVVRIDSSTVSGASIIISEPVVLHLMV